MAGWKIWVWSELDGAIVMVASKQLELEVFTWTWNTQSEEWTARNQATGNSVGVVQLAPGKRVRFPAQPDRFLAPGPYLVRRTGDLPDTAWDPRTHDADFVGAVHGGTTIATLGGPYDPWAPAKNPADGKHSINEFLSRGLLV